MPRLQSSQQRLRVRHDEKSTRRRVSSAIMPSARVTASISALRLESTRRVPPAYVWRTRPSTLRTAPYLVRGWSLVTELSVTATKELSPLAPSSSRTASTPAFAPPAG